jgi:hypothetical protein
VKESRTKLLSGRARKKLEDDKYHEDYFEPTDMDYPDTPQHRRLCKQVQHSKQYHDAEVNEVSKEKLLEASLLSLETMGKRHSKSSMDHLRASLSHHHSSYLDLQDFEENDERDGYETKHTGTTEEEKDIRYPSASYLRGALWIGRNLTLISEELTEELEIYRLKYLSEITEITKDNDFKRACHRLTLVATSGINHTCTLSNKNKTKIREILEVRYPSIFRFSFLDVIYSIFFCISLLIGCISIRARKYSSISKIISNSPN